MSDLAAQSLSTNVIETPERILSLAKEAMDNLPRLLADVANWYRVTSGNVLDPAAVEETIARVERASNSAGSCEETSMIRSRRSAAWAGVLPDTSGRSLRLPPSTTNQKDSAQVWKGSIRSTWTDPWVWPHFGAAREFPPLGLHR